MFSCDCFLNCDRALRAGALHVQCHDNATWAGCRNPPCRQGGYSSAQPVGCDAMTAQGHDYYSCDRYRDASGVTATQACTVACSGGDVTSCQEFDNCWDSPCLNGSVCTDGVGTFTCRCPPPLASTTDAEDNCSDECAASPCLNGGVCTDGIGTFTCACASHYGGPTCEVYCGPNQDCVRASVVQYASAHASVV